MSAAPESSGAAGAAIGTPAGATVAVPPVTERLARFAAGLSFDALPPAVVERVPLLLLDLAGIVVRGRDVDSTGPMVDALRALGQHHGGTATVLGSATRWQPQAAALLNGAAAHSLDFDDTHAPAQLHPGAPVIPAALAAAELAGADTRRLLTGIVAGYETMCRVSYGLTPITTAQLEDMDSGSFEWFSPENETESMVAGSGDTLTWT